MNELLKSDLTFQEVLNILENKENQQVFQQIKRALKKGKYPNEVLVLHLHKNICKNYKVFIQYLPFKQALNLTLNIGQIRQDLSKSFWLNILYPLVILLVAMIGMLLFAIYGYPNICLALATFEYDFSIITMFINILKFVIILILIIIATIGLFYCYISKKGQKVLFYIIMCRYFKTNIIKEYVSNMLILYFNECFKIGLSTRQTLKVLKSLQDPFLAFESYHLEKALLEGNSLNYAFNNPYVDEKLARFFKLALYASDLSLVLNKYLMFSKQRFQRKTKLFARNILIVSYGFIAVIIVFIYHILLIPITIIANL